MYRTCVSRHHTYLYSRHAVFPLFLIFFFFQTYCPPPHLHSFPTRRSSDLVSPAWSQQTRRNSTRTASPSKPHILGDREVNMKWITRKEDRKSTRLNSSHSQISYAVFCLKKKKNYRDINLSEHVQNMCLQTSHLSLFTSCRIPALSYFLFFSDVLPPPTSTLFPYTTLFRSRFASLVAANPPQFYENRFAIKATYSWRP